MQEENIGKIILDSGILPCPNVILHTTRYRVMTIEEYVDKITTIEGVLSNDENPYRLIKDARQEKKNLQDRFDKCTPWERGWLLDVVPRLFGYVPDVNIVLLSHSVGIGVFSYRV